MMFPRRMLDDDEAPDAARDVLREGSNMDPPEGAENAVWLALVAQMGAAGVAGAAGAAKVAASGAAAGGAAATGASGAVGAASGGLLKSILIGAISGVVAVTGYSAIEPMFAPAPAPTVTEPARAPDDKAPDDKRAAVAPAPSQE